MDQQAAPGWYGTGDGWVNYWDGQAWTGARAPAPAAPPPPQARRRQLPWPAWIVLIVLFIFIGLPLLSAFLQGFSTGLSGR
jgi:hypothetical protein